MRCGGDFLRPPPPTYYNVEDGELSLTKIVHDGRDDSSNIPTLPDFTISGGNTIKGLLSVLNNVVPNISARGVNFGVLAKRHRITITTGKYPYKMSDNLRCMLGFCNVELPTECALCNLCPQYAHMEKWKTYAGATAFDFKCGFNHLFFYCDMLAWRAVGEIRAPLLAVLPNKAEEMFGAIITSRFHNVQYVKVDKKIF